MNTTQHVLSALAVALSVAVVSPAVSAEAARFSQETKFQIGPQTLTSAVIQFSEQSGVQIVTTDTRVSGLKTRGVSGKLSVNEALKKLLEGTGLRFKQVGETAIALIDAGEGKRARNVAAPMLQLAQNVADPSAHESAASRSEQAETSSDEKKKVSEVVVTGSRIARATSQLAATVIVLDAEALRATGESTLEKALRQLPQNMLGTTEVGATVLLSGMSFNGALNITGGSNINLRGIGAESTLVLVDGRRIGKSGVYGGASDITGIPLSSVERVEIMLDGASSVYGSDAVGGVVNIILKKNYTGMEASYQYGVPQAKGFEEHTATFSGGKSWSDSHIRGTLEFYKNTNLDALERPENIYSNRWDSPGGIQGSLFYTYNGQNYTAAQLPGLGLTTTSPGVQFVRYTQLPEGYDGISVLPVSAFEPKSYTTSGPGYNSEIKEGQSLIPAREQYTAQLGYDKDFELGGHALSFSTNLYYSERDTYAGRGAFWTTFPLPANNGLLPFSGTVYWEIPEIGIQHYQTNQKLARANFVLEGEIGRGWHATLGGGKTRDKIDSYYQNSSTFARPAGFNYLASDVIAANSPALIALLYNTNEAVVALNQERSADFGVNGPLFKLPGGEVYLAVGTEWRKETLESRAEGGAPTQTAGEFNVSLPQTAYDGVVGRNQRSAYAELLLPIVGASNTMTGIHQLTLTGSTRYDAYDGYDSDRTWSGGLIWNPIKQVRFNVNHSTSFVVPTPREGLADTLYRNIGLLYRNAGINPFGLPMEIVDANGIPTGTFEYVETDIFYGNPDLKPEHAASWSGGVEFKPDFVPGLTLGVNWHETSYENRITASPSPVLVQGTDYVALYPNLTRDTATGRLILDRRAINASSMKTAGFDFTGRYNIETARGQFIATLNIGQTSKYDQQDFVTTPVFSRVGNVKSFVYAIIPKWRYTTNFGWYQGPWVINLDSSTSSDVSATNTTPTTVTRRTNTAAFISNLSVGYDMAASSRNASVPEWMRGTMLTVKVLNLLNDQPESRVFDVATGQITTYLYNANFSDPRGRMFYVNIAKRF